MANQLNDEYAQRTIAFYVVATAIFAATAWLAFISVQPLPVSAILYLNLFALALYDLRFFRLPNVLTATLFITGATSLWILSPYSIADHVIGAVAGLLLFPVMSYFYRRIRGRDGIGLGDAKLLAGLGLWLGWQALPPLLLLGSLSGLLYALLKYVIAPREPTDAQLAQPLPFGAFLCLSGWLVWLFMPL